MRDVSLLSEAISQANFKDIKPRLEYGVRSFRAYRAKVVIQIFALDRPISIEPVLGTKTEHVACFGRTDWHGTNKASEAAIHARKRDAAGAEKQ